MLVLMIALAAGAAAIAQSNSAPPEAVEAEKSFLALVDQGKFEEAWDAGASSMKNAVPKPAWQTVLAVNLRKCGTLVSRKLESAETSTSVSGGPDGQYAVFTYISVFSARKHAIEVVTLAKDDDGKWKAYRYEVKGKK
jgi:hypothetical protein